METELIYEVRSGDSVIAEFPGRNKALSEMKKLRRMGIDARVYSRWVRVTKKKVLKRREPEVRENWIPPGPWEISRE